MISLILFLFHIGIPGKLRYFPEVWGISDEGLTLALLCVIFHFSSNLGKGYKEKKSNNECIVCEEMMMLYKESLLRNGHAVGPSKLTNVSQVLCLNIFLVQSSLPHLRSLKVMNRTQTCFYNLGRQECLSVTSLYFNLINLVNAIRPFIKVVLIFIKCNE